MTEKRLLDDETRIGGGPAHVGRLTDVAHWQGRQPAALRFPEEPTPPAWFRHVAAHVPAGLHRTCLEVGVVPGDVLYYFARHLQYTCTGIDFSPRIALLPAAFAERGVAARFVQTDFFTWESTEQFDLVYSNGFVEHFTEVDRVIARHWQLVRPGGLMLLVMPTLTPVQWWVRRWCYTRERLREVLETHHTPIMTLPALRAAVLRCPQAEILAATYASEMRLWFGPHSPGVRRRARLVFPVLRRIERLVARSGRSSRWYSPEILVLARKEM